MRTIRMRLTDIRAIYEGYRYRNPHFLDGGYRTQETDEEFAAIRGDQRRLNYTINPVSAWLCPGPRHGSSRLVLVLKGASFSPELV